MIQRKVHVESVNNIEVQSVTGPNSSKILEIKGGPPILAKLPRSIINPIVVP